MNYGDVNYGFLQSRYEGEAAADDLQARIQSIGESLAALAQVGPYFISALRVF